MISSSSGQHYKFDVPVLSPGSLSWTVVDLSLLFFLPPQHDLSLLSALPSLLDNYTSYYLLDTGVFCLFNFQWGYMSYWHYPVGNALVDPSHYLERSAGDIEWEAGLSVPADGLSSTMEFRNIYSKLHRELHPLREKLQVSWLARLSGLTVQLILFFSQYVTGLSCIILTGLQTSV